MTTLPAALQEPTVDPTRRWIGLMTLASVGLWAGFFGPIQVLLAQQAEAISESDKESILALVSALGAVTSVICNPLTGAFSDRTVSRFGRRVPWMVAGVLGGGLSLSFMAVADSVWTMTLGWCAVQASLNAVLAGAVAMVPDQIPVHRRGRLGGIIALSQTIGIVAGTGIAAATGSIAIGYFAIAAFMVLTGLPFLTYVHDEPLPPEWREPFDARSFLRGFWISPREHPDFAWAWITRFLVNFGNGLGLLYLLYFLQDVLGYSKAEAEDRVFVLTAIYAGTLVLTAITLGAWSDRTGRRKVFVIWSGIVAGGAAALLGIGQSWPTAVVAAVVMGCSFGTYLSVDFAMITEVLPGAADRGKDLGVINIAAALPQVVAPVVAAGVLVIVERVGGVVDPAGDGFSVGYAVLFGIAFAASVLGSVLVTRIKGVR